MPLFKGENVHTKQLVDFSYILVGLHLGLWVMILIIRRRFGISPARGLTAVSSFLQEP